MVKNSVGMAFPNIPSGEMATGGHLLPEWPFLWPFLLTSPCFFGKIKTT